MEPLRLTSVLSCLVGALALDAQQKPAFVQEAGRSFVFDAPALSPPLLPKSDEKFFGKDYPDDLRPVVDAGKWSHPYPRVQSSSKFDSDYVKDENNDDGHWQAQIKYDTLKTKFAKQKDEVKKAEAAEGKAQKEAEAAAEASKKAAAAAGEAEDAAKTAESEATGAEKELAAAAGEDQTTEEKVAAGEKRADEAAIKLKGCQQNLADAKKELEDLKAQLAAEHAAHDKTKAEKADLAKSKEGTLAQAQAQAKTASAEAKASEAAAEKEEKQHEKAEQKVQNEKDELEHVGADYSDAENELRRLRGEAPLPKIPSAKDAQPAQFKSSASQRSLWLVAFAVVAAAGCA